MVFPKILPRNLLFLFFFGIAVFIAYVYFWQSLLSVQTARKNIQSEFAAELNEKIFYPLCQLKLTPETIENSDYEKYFVPNTNYAKVGVTFSDEDYISRSLRLYDIMFREYNYISEIDRVDYDKEVNCEDFSLQGSINGQIIEKFDLKSLAPLYDDSFVYSYNLDDSKVVDVIFVQDSNRKYFIENVSVSITKIIDR